MPEIKLTASGQLPGEALIVALLNHAATTRQTMSQENRDRWDHLQYVMLKGWHNFWISLGWPGEKI